MTELFGNYTGPYWSDGKIQSSVEFGSTEPSSALDELSRLHDSAYAHFDDERHRAAADLIYYQEAIKLKEAFPSLAANLVLYGNYAIREGIELFNDITSYGFLGPLGPLVGAIYNATGHFSDYNQMFNGQWLVKEMQEVQEFYKTDPRRNTIEPEVYATRRPPGYSNRVDVTEVKPETNLDYNWVAANRLGRRKRRRRRKT